MEPKDLTRISPPIVEMQERTTHTGTVYHHPVLRPRTLPFETAVSLFPGLEDAQKRVIDYSMGERFPGAVRTTWIEPKELASLYPGMNLSALGIFYVTADPSWLPPHELVREYEGEVFVRELNGGMAFHHFRTVKSAPDATPTLLLATEAEMMSAYALPNSLQEDTFIPLVALADEVLTVGGFYIDTNRFSLGPGYPRALKPNKSLEHCTSEKPTSKRMLQADLTARPWSRGYWPIFHNGETCWMALTSFL